MTFSDWVKTFRGVHERAKAGQITEDELREYLLSRNALTNAFLMPQSSFWEGQYSRKNLRVPLKGMVEVLFGEKIHQGTLTDLSWGGFGAFFTTLLVLEVDRKEAPLAFSLKLGSDATGVEGKALIVGKVRRGDQRVSFAFQQVTEPNLARIEFAVWDKVLDAIA